MMLKTSMRTNSCGELTKKDKRKRITPEMQQRFKELYNNGESSESIGKRFKFSHGVILNHLHKLNVKVRSKSEACKLALINGVFTVPPPKINKIPRSSKKLTKEKAYILGVLCGDGCIHCTKNKSYQIILNVSDEEFADEFLECIKKVYKLVPKKTFVKRGNSKWQDQFRIRLCSREVFRDLKRYNKSFKTFEWTVPNQIFYSPTLIKAKFLQGFFDSEGNVDFGYKRVRGYSSNDVGIKQVKNLLDSLNIRATVLDQKNATLKCISIQDRKSLEIFIKHIGFTIKRKKESLKKIIDSYILFKTPEEEVKKLVTEMMNLRKNGLSYARIANQLSISIMTVWNYLNKYE